MLLSDPLAADFINLHFVPCWESVRPVPKVTIDFGDGRVLKRTLKGNTVMFVCLADGRVVDALPGIYTPDHFMKEASQTLQRLQASDFMEHPEAAIRWHQDQIQGAIAAEQARVSMSKAVIESPLLSALGLAPFERGVASPSPEMPQSRYAQALDKLSRRLVDMSRMPATSQELQDKLLQGQNDLSPRERGRLAMALDSQASLQLLRPAVHMLLATYDRLPTPQECRVPIFKKLLHVDVEDPNLGLTDFVLPGTP